MSLHLKSLSFWNIEKMNWFSNNSPLLIKEIKQHVDNMLPKQDTINDELIISCIHGIYAHRTGLFGYIFKMMTQYIRSEPVYLRSFINTHWFRGKNVLLSNDFELLTGSLSYINKFIPLLNVGIWDDKKIFLNYQNKTSCLRYCNSTPCLLPYFSPRPLFDHGCGIFSNKEPMYKGFISFSSSSLELTHRGILWNYYRTETTGICILTFILSMVDGNDDEEDVLKIKYEEVKTILETAQMLEKIYVKNDYNFECYIIGDFIIDIVDIVNYFGDESNLFHSYQITKLEDGGFIFLLNKSSHYDFVYNTSFLSNNKVTKPMININFSNTSSMHLTINTKIHSPLSSPKHSISDDDGNNPEYVQEIDENNIDKKISPISSLSSLNSDEWAKIHH